MLATMQLLLNLPNYVLQLVDEFSNLRATSQRFVEFYLYADALFYLMYLSQYPMLAIYVRWLHSNFNEQHSGSGGGGKQQKQSMSTSQSQIRIGSSRWRRGSATLLGGYSRAGSAVTNGGVGGRSRSGGGGCVGNRVPQRAHLDREESSSDGGRRSATEVERLVPNECTTTEDSEGGGGGGKLSSESVPYLSEFIASRVKCHSACL